MGVEMGKSSVGRDLPQKSQSRSKDMSAFPHKYEIRVENHLGDNWTEWFEQWNIFLEDDGTTRMTGLVADLPALYGTIEKIAHLNLALISVQRIESEPDKEV